MPFSPLPDPCFSLSTNKIGQAVVTLNKKEEETTVCIGGQTHFCFTLRNTGLFDLSGLKYMFGSNDTSMHNMHVNDLVS